MVRFLFLAVCLATFLSASANENAFREDPDMILAEVGSSMGSGSDSSMGSGSTSMDSGSGSSSTSTGSGSGSDDNVYGETCVDVKQSDGTEWFDADGEYYDCEW